MTPRAVVWPRPAVNRGNIGKSGTSARGVCGLEAGRILPPGWVRLVRIGAGTYGLMGFNIGTTRSFVPIARRRRRMPLTTAAASVNASAMEGILGHVFVERVDPNTIIGLPRQLFDTNAGPQDGPGGALFRPWSRIISRGQHRVALRSTRPILASVRSGAWSRGSSAQLSGLRARASVKDLHDTNIVGRSVGAQRFATDEPTLPIGLELQGNVLEEHRISGAPLAPHQGIGSVTNRYNVPGRKASAPGPTIRSVPLPPFEQDVGFVNTQRKSPEQGYTKDKQDKNVRGTLYLDGSTLSDWLTAYLGREAARPRTGTMAVDLRATPAWAVPSVAM